MPVSRITYLEFPAQDVAEIKRFYAEVFGWTFQDYGPEYATFLEAGIEGGFNGDYRQRTKAPLPIVQTDDLELMLQKVMSAGGVVTMPIFSFPGGRRFHFRDCNGNELAVMQSQG
jgi:predicted enzyme related to lactoylglutathione lyase